MEVSWEEDVEVLKLLCFSRQNFVTENLCGYVNVFFSFCCSFAKPTDDAKPCVVQAIIISIRGLTIEQHVYFVMSVIF